MLKKLIFGLLGLMLLISSASATSSLTIGTPTYSSSVLKDESFTVEVPIQAASVSSQITVTVTLIDNTNGVTITSAVKTISYSSDGTQNIQWSVKANNPGTYSNPFTIQATANDGGQASPLTSTTSLSIKDRPVLTVNVSQNTTSVSPNGYVRLEYTITNIASPEAASATDMNASLTTIPENWTVISPTNYGISSLSAGGSQTSGYFIVMAPSTSSNYSFNLSVISAQGDSISKSWNIEVAVENEESPGIGSPTITGYAPASPATDTPGATRVFNVTANQTVNVTWYINGTQVQYNTSTTDAIYTNTSAVAGTWTVNATANNTNGTVSQEWTWIVSAASAPRTSSGGSSGGTGGGGGGSGSPENSANIEMSEKYDMQISKGTTTSYKFTNKKNPIMFINITGAKSMGIITTSAEVLKGTSTIVNTPAEGLVYKNINIWVGTKGYATPTNIKEALIKFRIDNAWLSANNVEGSDIVLVRWDGSSWVQLETKVLSKDDSNTYLEGKTDYFSPFAITAPKNAVVPEPAVQDTETKGTQKPADDSAAPAPTKKAYGFSFVLAILILSAVYLFRQNRR
ncbi:MAG: PGF-pre-PGF domain-containing protein [Candidatus Methanoperedens sp.]